MDKRNQILAAFAATVGAFNLGTVLSWTSPAIPAMLIIDGDEFDYMTHEDVSWIGAIICLGAFCSAPICGLLMSRAGRKNTLLLLSVPCVVGWLLVGYSMNMSMMLTGRFISGFCGGGFSLLSPLYVSEISQDKIRGSLVCIYQLMVVLGIEFVYIAGTLASWQWLAIICGFIPLIFLIGMVFIPESPPYLISHSEMEEASDSLKWLRFKEIENEIERELNHMQSSHDRQKKESSNLLLWQNLKPTLLVCGLMFFQQCSGINAVIFYTVEIFQSAVSDVDADICSIVVGGVQIAATLSAVLSVDRLGRKLLLFISSIFMCFSLIGLGAYFRMKENDVENHISWMPLPCLLIFMIAYSLGFGPVPLLMMVELLPARIIEFAAPIAVMTNWLLAFAVTKFFNRMLNLVKEAWSYWAFSIVCGLGAIFVYFCIPETKGKSFKEIESLLRNKRQLILVSASNPPTPNDNQRNK